VREAGEVLALHARLDWAAVRVGESDKVAIGLFADDLCLVGVRNLKLRGIASPGGTCDIRLGASRDGWASEGGREQDVKPILEQIHAGHGDGRHRRVTQAMEKGSPRHLHLGREWRLVDALGVIIQEKVLAPSQAFWAFPGSISCGSPRPCRELVFGLRLLLLNPRTAGRQLPQGCLPERLLLAKTREQGLISDSGSSQRIRYHNA
jgi:hypothetical protein